MDEKERKKARNKINLIIMEKLRKTSMQNFSAILNTPNEEYSYYTEISNYIYSTLYDEKSNLDFEIEQDFDKFSGDDIEIGFPIKKALTEKKNNNNEKISFKRLLSEQLDKYINSINNELGIYNLNHKSYEENEKNFMVFKRKRASPKEDTIFNYYTNIYKTNKKILEEIPDEFFEDNNKFKLKSEILEMNIKDLEKKNKELISISGKIDLELEKILDHSNRIENYINDNINPFENIVDNSYDKIIRWKEIYKELKLKNQKNSIFLISKEIKRENLKKMNFILLNVKKLKEVIDLLQILITNPKKYKITSELIIKSKETMLKLKSDKRIKNFKLFDSFESSLLKFSSKSSSQMITEFSDILSEYYKNIISVNKDIKNTNETFHITNYVFDKLLNSSDNAKKYILNFNLLINISIEKIKERIQTYIKNDIINSFYPKIRGIFTHLSNEKIKEIYSELKEEIIKNNNKLNSKEKAEQSVTILLIYGRDLLYNSICNIIDEILKEIDSSNQITKTVKNNFMTEFEEIKKIVNDNLTRVVHNQIIQSLNETLDHTDIDSFIEGFYISYDITKIFISKNEKIKSVFGDCQINFVRNYSQMKNDNFIKSDSWEEIKQIPFIYQKLLNSIISLEINTNCMKENEDYSFLLDKIQLFQKIENEKKEEENNNLNYISFSSIKLKCNQSSLDIIKTSYEILKLFILFNQKAWNEILETYTNIMREHIEFQKEEILKGKNIEITQTEISMTNSILELIKNITQRLKNSESFNLISKYVEQNTIDDFLDMIKTIDDILIITRKKIEDLIQERCINDSLKELEKINLPNYNIAEDDVRINNYSLNLVSLIKTLYDSMLNSYDEYFIVDTIKNALKKFFDKFEEFILKGEKIEDIESLKQFKKDTIFLKKNLPSLTLVNMDEFKIKIDNINKKVLPESLLKKKNQK